MPASAGATTWPAPPVNGDRPAGLAVGIVVAKDFGPQFGESPATRTRGSSQAGATIAAKSARSAATAPGLPSDSGSRRNSGWPVSTGTPAMASTSRTIPAAGAGARPPFSCSQAWQAGRLRLPCRQRGRRCARARRATGRGPGRHRRKTPGGAGPSTSTSVSLPCRIDTTRNERPPTARRRSNGPPRSAPTSTSTRQPSTSNRYLRGPIWYTWSRYKPPPRCNST